MKKQIILSVAVLMLIVLAVLQFKESVKGQKTARRDHLSHQEEVQEAGIRYQEAGEEAGQKIKAVPPEMKRASDLRVSRFKSKSRRFLDLKRVTIKSKREREEWERLLKDQKYLNEAYVTLAELEKYVDDAERNEVSMIAVDVLDSALQWQGNPLRADVIQKMKYLLFQDLVSSQASLKMNRTKAGNQLEIYLSLKKHEPSAAREVKARAYRTRLSDLIAFAEANFKN